MGVMKLCGNLATRGVEVELIVPAGRALPLSSLGTADSVFDFYSIPSRFGIRYLPNPLKRATAAAALYALFMYRYARSKGVSLVHTRNLEVAYWASFFKTPVVYESHNYAKAARSWLLAGFIKRIQQKDSCAYMVVTTHAGKRSYVRRGIPEGRILVTPNGVDVQTFESLPDKEVLRQRLDLPAADRIVAFSGSLYEGRGVEEMLRSAELLRDLTFLVVGGSPAEVDKYRAMTSRMRLDNVIFVGHVPQALVPSYLKACDILLMPYTTKTAHDYMSPMKTFDYLASGCAIVATDFPILHEVLRDKENAVFVAPDSGEAMADGIKWLLDHPEAAKEISAQAKKDAAQYSWENRADAILKWIHRALECAGRSNPT